MTASQVSPALVKRVIASFSKMRQLSFASLKPDLTFAEVSDNFLTTIEHSDQDVVGKPISDILIEFIGAEEQLKSIMQGETTVYELPHVNRQQTDGSLKYLTFTVIPLNSKKPDEGLILIVENATSIGEMEQRLTQQRNELSLLKNSLQERTTELEVRNRELDAFSHAVAHDLRNPLSGIVGFIGLIEASLEDGTASQKQWLKKTMDNIMRISVMIDSLLLLSQLRTAEQMLQSVEVSKVISEVLTRLKSRLDDRKIKVDVAKDIPPAMGYQPWLEIAFINLVENAAKYMGTDNPEPRIKIRGKRSGDKVRYEVEDNGLGIPEEAQTQLFEMFSRFHVSHAKGFGIGLSIVNRIIQKLGGKVGVKSKMEEGSTFWFELEAVKEEKR